MAKRKKKRRTRAPARGGTVVGVAAVALAFGSAQAVAEEPPAVPREAQPLTDLSAEPQSITAAQAAELFSGGLLQGGLTNSEVGQLLGGGLVSPQGTGDYLGQVFGTGLVSAPAGPGQTNVAILGDSFAAGLGAGTAYSRGSDPWANGGAYFNPADPRGQSQVSPSMQSLSAIAQSNPGMQYNVVNASSASAKISDFYSDQLNPDGSVRNSAQMLALSPETQVAYLGFGGNTIGFADIATAAVNETLSQLDFQQLVRAATPMLDGTLPLETYVEQANTSKPGQAPTVAAQIMDMVLTANAAAPNAQLLVGGYPDFADPTKPTDGLDAHELETAGALVQALNAQAALGVALANIACDSCATVVDHEGVMKGQNALYGATSGIIAPGVLLGHKSYGEMMHPNGWGARLMGTEINKAFTSHLGLPQSLFPTLTGLPGAPPLAPAPRLGQWALPTFTLPSQVPNLAVRNYHGFSFDRLGYPFPGTVPVPLRDTGFVVPQVPTGRPGPLGLLSAEYPNTLAWSDWADWQGVLGSGFVEPYDPDAGSMIVSDGEVAGFTPDMSDSLGPAPGSSLGYDLASSQLGFTPDVSDQMFSGENGGTSGVSIGGIDEGAYGGFTGGGSIESGSGTYSGGGEYGGFDGAAADTGNGASVNSGASVDTGSDNAVNDGMNGIGGIDEGAYGGFTGGGSIESGSGTYSGGGEYGGFEGAAADTGPSSTGYADSGGLTGADNDAGIGTDTVDAGSYGDSGGVTGLA